MKSAQLLFIPIFFTLLLTGCGSEETAKPEWAREMTSEKAHFKARLLCTKAPDYKDFQRCKVLLTASDERVAGAVISIDGGMKAHGHGLPTEPKVIEEEQPGSYRIDGLKFSMPGEWLLGFKIRAGKLSDQVVFKLKL